MEPDSVKQKVKEKETLNMLTENDLEHCFEQWEIRMERCRDILKGRVVY